MYIDIRRIYEKYQTLNIPNTFNDEQIEHVRDLYKNGHYLRYFGAQNGSGIYLYKP